MEKETNATLVANALKTKGAIAFAPNGDSMWPFIKNHGQTVIVERLNESPKVLDVVLFIRNDGSLVLHRVLAVNENLLTLCGDSQFTTETISPDSVIGVMTKFYKGKKVVSARNSKYLKQVEKWYKRKKLRKFRIKLYFFGKRIKAK